MELSLVRDLEPEEWQRFYDRDRESATNLAARSIRRETLLVLGHKKRVPKHRVNKKGAHLP